GAKHGHLRYHRVTGVKRERPGPVTGPGLLYEWLALSPTNVVCLQALRAAVHRELDFIALGEALEALGLDGAEVDEYVFATLLGDEAETLRVVEPLDCTCCHGSCTSSSEACASVFPATMAGAALGGGGQTKKPRDMRPPRG